MSAEARNGARPRPNLKITTMKTLEIKIENGSATMYFNGMLNEDDFKLFWQGIDPETNDGSSSEDTETVSTIRSIYETHVKEGEYDFQIWGAEPSFTKHIDAGQVSALVNELIAAFPDLSVEYI
jgi:hypothetical protein